MRDLKLVTPLLLLDCFMEADLLHQGPIHKAPSSCHIRNANNRQRYRGSAQLCHHENRDTVP